MFKNTRREKFIFVKVDIPEYNLFVHYLGITHSSVFYYSLAKDHWLGFNTWNAHVVHIVNSIWFSNGVPIFTEVSFCIFKKIVSLCTKIRLKTLSVLPVTLLSCGTLSLPTRPFIPVLKRDRSYPHFSSQPRNYFDILNDLTQSSSILKVKTNRCRSVRMIFG